MKIIIATTNESKFLEAKSVLQKFSIECEQAAIEIDEPKTLSIEETILKKSANAFAIVKKPLVVEDTCIFFDAYQNFPGTYTKFAVETLGIEGLLKLLEGKQRGAKFVTMAAWTGGRKTEILKGETIGTIVETPRGASRPKLPYDSIFSPESESKTFAEMAVGEKEKYSHRAKAFEKLAEWLCDASEGMTAKENWAKKNQAKKE